MKCVDKKQVRAEDNEQLRVGMRHSKLVLWDISNQTPTQLHGSRAAAPLTNHATGSCFITSLGILSIISPSSTFWYSATAWAVGRCPQHSGSTGCPLWLHGLSSTRTKAHPTPSSSPTQSLSLWFCSTTSARLNNALLGDFSWWTFPDVLRTLLLTAGNAPNPVIIDERYYWLLLIIWRTFFTAKSGMWQFSPCSS